MTETGNRKIYDQAFKYLPETDLLALLAMLGAVAPDAAPKITRLPKELISSTLVIPDELHLIEENGEPWIAHIEAQTGYASDIPVRLVNYANCIRIVHNLPVRSFLLLLTKHGVPDSVPTEGVIEMGRLRLTFSYEVVKLWEMAADAFLAADQPSLLPFIPLMKGGELALETVGERLMALSDATRRRALQSHFWILGGLHYDAETLIAAMMRKRLSPHSRDRP